MYRQDTSWLPSLARQQEQRIISSIKSSIKSSTLTRRCVFCNKRIFLIFNSFGAVLLERVHRPPVHRRGLFTFNSFRVVTYVMLEALAGLCKISSLKNKNALIIRSQVAKFMLRFIGLCILPENIEISDYPKTFRLVNIMLITNRRKVRL